MLSYIHTIAEEEKDFLLIDTNCRANWTKTHDLYLAIPYCGSVTRTVRLCVITRDSSTSVTNFRCKIRKSDEEKSKGWTTNIHRLVNIVANHNGFGINNHTPLREYLQLQEEETITFNRRFVYHDFTNERSARLIKRRLNGLQRKEWLEVKLATICDIDHMIGRSELQYRMITRINTSVAHSQHCSLPIWSLSCTNTPSVDVHFWCAHTMAHVNQ